MSPRVSPTTWRISRALAAWAPFLMVFLLLECPILYYEWKRGRRAHLKIRPGTVLLFGICVNHALFRVLAFHPIFQKGYRAWLESTPWTYRKPLPLGPVELTWADGLTLGILILLRATQPEPRAPQMLCIFLFANLIALTLSFWLTRSSAFGYTTAFALGFAVIAWRRPWICLAVLTGTYLIAYEGLRRAMAAFPWTVRKLPRLSEERSTLTWQRETCGWPHDRMMAQIVADRGVSRIDVVLLCMLAGWWCTAMISQIREPDSRTVASACVFAAAIGLAPLLRMMIYQSGYSPPIGVWGRIWTLRWIIPGYDRVFIAPICALIAGPATLVLLRACGLPQDASLIFAAGMVVLVATLTPPRLRTWRLTGHHRIMNQNSFSGPSDVLVQVR